MSTDSLSAETLGPDGRPIGKREATKANNRQAILNAAREVFAELGFGETTVRDIIRRTGLASGTFYNYFRSKEEVFQALNDQLALEVRPALAQVRREAETFEKFVGDTFRIYFEYVGRDRTGFAMARRNAGHQRIRMDSPEVVAGFEELRADVRRAVETGLAPPIDADYLTSAMIGTAFEMAEVMLERETVDAAGAAGFATALFLGGISALPHTRIKKT